MPAGTSQFTVDAVSSAYWRISFDNPPYNLLNPETIREFQTLVDQIESDDALRVVVFDSANPDYFFGRYDLSRAAETPTEVGPSGLPMWTDMTVRLTQASVVSIALMRGRMRGGGAELALSFDMRFASLEKAIFGQPEVGAGVIPGGGALERLPMLMGRPRTLEVVLGSEDFDARTAELYGWVNRALPDAELDAHVDRLARRIATYDRAAIAEAKRLVNRRTLPDPRDLMETLEVFLRVTAESVGARAAGVGKKLAEVGPDEFEKNMGRYLGEL
jgi:enoyl-CoA hydratase/carnithine racemase